MPNGSSKFAAFSVFCKLAIYPTPLLLSKNSPELHQSQERPLVKVRWTCPPQSTLWRCPCPKSLLGGMNGRFQAKLAKYSSFCNIKKESLANAKVNERQHCVVQSHWNADNAIGRTTMFHVVASQTCVITRNSKRIRPYSSSRSSKVIDLGVNGKPIGDFLVVINSNFSRTWYRFGDTDA